ncbi:hypothetical protein ACLK9F_001699 [Campylobacter coli]
MKNKFIKISIVLSSFLSSAIIKPIETSIADIVGGKIKFPFGKIKLP